MKAGKRSCGLNRKGGTRQFDKRSEHRRVSVFHFPRAPIEIIGTAARPSGPTENENGNGEKGNEKRPSRMPIGHDTDKRERPSCL